MKNVLINALFIDWGKNGGTETYLTNIIKPWYENDNDDIRFTLLVRSLPPWWSGDNKNFNVRIVTPLNTATRLIYEQLIAPLFIYKRFDLIFSPGYVGSILSSQKQIITVHDCFAWVFPKQIGILRSFYWKFFIPLSLKRAKAIIAVSNNTKSDLIRFLNIDGNNIFVIHESGENIISFKTKKQIQLSNRYFHCVGFFKDIKNPYKIIEAYIQYRKRSVSPCELLLIGNNNNKVGKKINQMIQMTEGIRVIGFVDNNSLSQVYANSNGLLFISLYEGFGIPILEAQHLECPVVTSNISSMPEISGSSAILVNPFNVKEITEAMLKLDQPDIRKTLISNGRENIVRFNWEKASQETIKLIKTKISNE